MHHTVIFDLGGVLVDWDPRHMYRKIIQDEEEMEYFLGNIATQEWNGKQDEGRTLEEATEWLVGQHPGYEDLIRAYYGRWEEMLKGPIEGTLAILNHIHDAASHRLIALTNWSHETFPTARRLFPWLGLFEGIVVSGEEKMMKPDPRIYQLLLDRYEVDPKGAVFIDDNQANVESARTLGIHAIQFQSPEVLRAELTELNVL